MHVKLVHNSTNKAKRGNLSLARQARGKPMIKLRIKVSCRVKVSGLLLVMGLTLLGVAKPVQAESFGQIFTTPEQRSILDDIRRHSRQKNPKQKKMKSKTLQTTFDNKSVNVNGIVIRSDGKNTVWINGRRHLNTNAPETGVKVHQRSVTSDSVTITLSENPSKRITLKPGQIVDPRSGRVRDSYKLKYKLKYKVK